MTDVKQELLTLIKNSNPKGYASYIKRREKLVSYVSDLQQKLGTRSIAETLYCFAHNQNPNVCGCGKLALFNTFQKGYRQFCSMSCPEKGKTHAKKIRVQWSDQEKLNRMIEARNKTNLEKYGVSNPLQSEIVKEKIRKTCQERYGADSPLESKKVQERIAESMIERYGVAKPFQSSEILARAKKTFADNHPDISDSMALARAAFFEKHGVNPFQVPSIKAKARASIQKKYGVAHVRLSHLSPETVALLDNAEQFRSAVSGHTLAEAAVKIGVDPATIVRRCAMHDCRDVISNSTRSAWEFRIKNLLDSFGLVEGVDYVRSERTILKGLELDFYFPKANLALEVGSIFWHSELTAGRGMKYHANKWKQCAESGITLLQYWDSEMIGHWAVIESKLRYHLGLLDQRIGARRITSISVIDKEKERAFLDSNHVQGFAGDRKVCYGAWVESELVAVFALAHRRSSWEITRYATKLGAVYSGLFTKMLKHAVKDQGIRGRIFSFSDNRHGSGNVYFRSGFKHLSSVAPSYYYTKNYHQLLNRKSYTKPKIARKFSIDDTSKKTEWQLMQELGYDRIWDAGKKKWVIDV